MTTENTPARVLPPLYAKWMDQLLGSPIPPETDATCSDCTMCFKPGERTRINATYFDPKTKCCTYFPHLPPFLVGGVLTDPDLTSNPLHATVDAGLSADSIVSPLGVCPSGKYRILYKSPLMGFGQDTSMRCPYLVHAEDHGPSCGIWRHRQSVCATWFCRWVRGRLGEVFWKDMHFILGRIEEALTWWCILQLDFSADDLKALRSLFGQISKRADGHISGRLDYEIGADRYSRVWGGWKGREAQFFIETAQRVQALSWQDILNITGPEIHMAANILKKSFAALTRNELPKRLKVGEFRVIEMDSQRCRVICKGPLGPMEIPNDILRCLKYFDGRLTEKAITLVRDKEQVNLSPNLVRRLSDFCILEPVR